MKRIAVLAILGLVAAALVVPSTTAQAATGAAAGLCTTSLPEWPTTGARQAPDCTGTAFGVGVSGTTPVNCAAGCNFRATVDSYSEPCVLNEPPLVGFANGDIFVTPPGESEVAFGSYSWTRVGLVAVIVPDGVDPAGAAGVAAFIPDVANLGTCDVHATGFNVTVAGALVSAL